MCDFQPVDRHLVLSAVEVNDIVLIMYLDDAVRARVRAGERFAVAIQANEDIPSACQVCRNLGELVAVVSWRRGKS